MADLIIEKQTTFQYLLSAFLRLAESFRERIRYDDAGEEITETNQQKRGVIETGREQFIVPFLQRHALPILLETAVAYIVSAEEQDSEGVEEEDEDDIEATREESNVAVENLVMLVQALIVPENSMHRDGPSRLSFEELMKIREVAFKTLAVCPFP